MLYSSIAKWTAWMPSSSSSSSYRWSKWSIHQEIWPMAGILLRNIINFFSFSFLFILRSFKHWTTNFVPFFAFHIFKKMLYFFAFIVISSVVYILKITLDIFKENFRYTAKSIRMKQKSSATIMIENAHRIRRAIKRWYEWGQFYLIHSLFSIQNVMFAS